MKIKFWVPVEPFSINAMYGRDKRHKTQKYKDWECQVLNYLHLPAVQESLNRLRTAYKEGEHAFAVRFDFYYKDLLNKQGTISSRCEDLSNVEKVLLDILFLPKFHVQPFPYGVPNLNCDDKHVTTLISRKLIGPETGIGVQIRLVKAPKKP